MAKLIKQAAMHTPGLGRVLREKRQLQGTVAQQQKHIAVLTDRNAKLRIELEARKTAGQAEPIWPLLKSEILKAAGHKPTERPSTKTKPPFVINWVVPGAVVSSGGQSDIFRTIKYLRQKGHTCRIYIFDPPAKSNLAEQKALIQANFSGLGNQIFYNAKQIADCDIIFATHWLTAYPVYNFAGQGRKYYYVQGYEPHTQPAGYLGYLAEATYSFGFRGLTLGQWLCDKLTREYKMRCDYFNYGYDPEEYRQVSTKPRRDIFYYAQPAKAHRGFELGIMALEIFHRQNPKSTIYLFGADLKNYKIPFPYKAKGIMTVPQLNELYNHCAAGLALSFTNISLIPLEMVAAGCRPVINDSTHTRLIKYAEYVKYAKPEPQAIADALSQAVKDNTRGLNAKLSDIHSWQHSNHQIEKYLINDLAR